MPGLILPFEGHVPEIDPTAWVAHTATLIGRVRLAAEANVWFGCTLRGDDMDIVVGARTNIQDGTVVHVTAELSATMIGADVTIGHNCTIHACTLHDRAFVGMGSTVLDGAVIESDAMLAAGAVLTPGKRIPSGQLWAGNPARPMRDLRPQDLENARFTVAHYVGRAKQFARLSPLPSP